MSRIFRLSPLSLTVKQDDEHIKLHHIEIKDFVRAFCGGLFIALPLHFTMEMWERARVISPRELILILVVSYFANVGFNIFSGYKDKKKRRAAYFDAVESMGVGILVSALTLILIDQISPQIPLFVVLKVIALESVPTSFGAALARNQLGGGSEKVEIEDQYSADARKIGAAFLGALLFAFNIAPTVEPIVIAASLQWFQLAGIIFYSLFVSYLIIFIAGFKERRKGEGDALGSKVWETVISYIISLIVSAVLLWMFGYLTTDTSFAVGLPWVIVLGYATTLGGAAGRIIL